MTGRCPSWSRLHSSTLERTTNAGMADVVTLLDYFDDGLSRADAYLERMYNGA